MTLNSAALLLARCLGVSLLMLVGASYLIGFLAVDTGGYFFYKVARGDFYHWVPIYGGPGIVVSVLERVAVKVIADFTGVVQFRAPGEMGGLYFTVNTAMGFVFCFAAIKIFFASGVGREGVVSEDFATKAFVGLFGFWALNAALGVKIMKKEYRGTFVSMETGNWWAQKFFLEGDTDKARSKTMRLNKKKWESIEGPVKEWVQKNWGKWREEEPDWFTDAWIVKVPDDFIPAGENRVALQKLRRKSSLFGKIDGGDGNRRLSLGGGGAATIVPVSGAVAGAGAQGGAQGGGKVVEAPNNPPKIIK
jgi:hypothetical protein